MNAGRRKWFGGPSLGPGKTAALLALSALVVGAVTFVGYGNRQPTDPPEEVTGYGRAYEALCRARAAAQNGDAPEARDIFYDGAHAGLHRIADEVAGMDRPLAADLLRAKNAVEASFGSSAGGHLESQLDELLRVSQMALESLGASYSLCTF